MAKKKTETPVYPEAPLVIPREQFCTLLSEQIAKGKDLLAITVPMAQRQQSYDYGFLSASRVTDRVKYDEVAEKDFIARYNRWNDRNKVIYRTSFSEPESIYYHEYEQQRWNAWGSDLIKDYKDEIQRLMSHMQGDIERVDLIRCDAPALVNKESETMGSIDVKNKKRVFLVHGHNSAIREKVELLLMQLGYHPVVLFKEASKSQTIIEKLESESRACCYSIVLYTKCDEGREMGTEELRPRARQNVVFEHGYMCAQMGRDHVCAILEDGVEPPGDLSGVIYVSYDDKGSWRYTLANEMRAIGLDVDLNMIK